MTKIVLISGRLCTGKSGLATELQNEFGFRVLKSSDLLKALAEQRGSRTDRMSLRALSDSLDAGASPSWLYDGLIDFLKKDKRKGSVVIDGIRSRKHLDCIRKDHSLETTHVHLYASDDELRKRFEKWNLERSAEERFQQFDDADVLGNSEDIAFFREDADVRIYTNRSDSRDTLVRVAARLGLYSSPGARTVDVIIGGQYGSEGKGHIAAYLARDYDVLVRVGGPNAGHSVSSPSGVYIYHQLPSGARDTDAKLLLGPGMTINVKNLLREIDECKITPERLFIDPQAMIIDESDIESEQGIVSTIASTGSGGGAAAARRIRNRQPGKTKLARNIPELTQFVGAGPPYRGSTTAQLELAYRNGDSILLEGTQGSGLSLYHGAYPYVTSRDTNVAGCLAEAGISPSRVRRILMVVRFTPIRVGNPDAQPGLLAKTFDYIANAWGVRDGSNSAHWSGPLKHETSFDEVARLSGLNADDVKKNEKTSTTKRKRRVGWFDWEQFHNACSLNAPTDIVLTFSDYIRESNQRARRFEQLHTDTIKFVEELERVARAPVSLITTRFPRDDEPSDLRSVIDRRNWTTSRRSSS